MAKDTSRQCVHTISGRTVRQPVTVLSVGWSDPSADGSLEGLGG